MAAGRRWWRSPIAWIAGVAVIVVAVAALVTRFLPIGGQSAPSASPAPSIALASAATPTNVAFERTLGRPDAPVRLIVWSDFQCAACRDFAQTSELRLIQDFVVPGKLRIEFRDLAVVGPESPAAAAAARCAEQQDRFWPYHDLLFANLAPENSGQLGPVRLKAMADALGLDRVKFDACLPSGTVFNDVEAETAQGKLRGSSVPILDFGSVVLEGSASYDQLHQTVEQLIAAAPTVAPSAAP